MRRHAAQLCASALRAPAALVSRRAPAGAAALVPPAAWAAGQAPCAPALCVLRAHAAAHSPAVGGTDGLRAPAGRSAWLAPGACQQARGMGMTAAARKRKQEALTVLTGELRERGMEFGKHESRVLRTQGWVPGRIQTREGDVVGAKFNYDDIKSVAFDPYLKNTIFTVKLKDQEPMRCIVREMQVQLRLASPWHRRAPSPMLPSPRRRHGRRTGYTRGGLWEAQHATRSAAPPAAHAATFPAARTPR